MRSDIPVEVLDEDMSAYLGLSKRERNALRYAGLERVWHLLLFREDELQSGCFMGYGRQSGKLTIEKLHARNLRPGSLAEYGGHWRQSTRCGGECRYRGFDLYLFAAVNSGLSVARVEAFGPQIVAFCEQHGYSRGMKTRELFMQGRPPLSPEQIAFLQEPASVLESLPGMEEGMLSGWWSTIGASRPITVWDVACELTQLRVDEPGVPRLRAQIEQIVGPLPLQITMQELKAIKHVSRPTVVCSAPYVEMT